MSKNNREQKQKKMEDVGSVGKVKMIFSSAKFYNDLNNPIFEAGKVYELEGADWIQRWEKRGGMIVGERMDLKEYIKNLENSDKEEKTEETDSRILEIDL